MSKPRTKPNTQRINLALHNELNDWLDSESQRTGYSKTTLISLAVENYKQQRTAQVQVNELAMLIEKLEKIQENLGDE